MLKISYSQLESKPVDAEDEIIRGTSRNGKIDKSAHFYHVMTRSWAGETIFYPEFGQYRNRLLGRLCAEKGITILFSVAMPNHTHELFMTDSWEILSQVMRLLNTQLSHYVRTLSKKNYGTKRKVFDPQVLYVAIKDIGTLFYVGKYIFDNPGYLVDKGKKVPFTCFWMIENGFVSQGYDLTLYRKLFGMDADAVRLFYQNHSKQEVREYSSVLAKSWSAEDMKAVFYRD